ncbi:DUF397 domain-containing protein [Amycolatopsis sp. NPDC005003]
MWPRRRSPTGRPGRECRNDTKDRSGGTLAVGSAAWRAFLRKAKR